MSDLYNLSNLKVGDWVWFEREKEIKLGEILQIIPHLSYTAFAVKHKKNQGITSICYITNYDIIRKEMPLTNTYFQASVSKPLILYPKNVEYILHFLPTKIVFNIDKGKTTLLFGSQGNYETFTATIEDFREFVFVQGFSVAYYKFIKSELNEPKETQQMIQKMYNLGIGDMGFQTIAKEHIIEEGLSVTQTKKLFDKLASLLPKNNTFKMNVTVGKNMIHEIEVVVKIDYTTEGIKKRYENLKEKK